MTTNANKDLQPGLASSGLGPATSTTVPPDDSHPQHVPVPVPQEVAMGMVTLRIGSHHCTVPRSRLLLHVHRHMTRTDVDTTTEAEAADPLTVLLEEHTPLIDLTEHMSSFPDAVVEQVVKAFGCGAGSSDGVSSSSDSDCQYVRILAWLRAQSPQTQLELLQAADMLCMTPLLSAATEELALRPIREKAASVLQVLQRFRHVPVVLDAVLDEMQRMVDRSVQVSDIVSVLGTATYALVLCGQVCKVLPARCQAWSSVCATACVVVNWARIHAANTPEHPPVSTVRELWPSPPDGTEYTVINFPRLYRESSCISTDKPQDWLMHADMPPLAINSDADDDDPSEEVVEDYYRRQAFTALHMSAAQLAEFVHTYMFSSSGASQVDAIVGDTGQQLYQAQHPSLSLVHECEPIIMVHGFLCPTGLMPTLA